MINLCSKSAWLAGLVLLTGCATSNQERDDYSESLVGLWKTDCALDFGVRIQRAQIEGEYTIGFCGPGDCFKPNTWRPNSPIVGDDSYELVSSGRLRILGSEGWTEYQKCQAVPDRPDPYDRPTTDVTECGSLEVPLLNWNWVSAKGIEGAYVYKERGGYEVQISRDQIIDSLVERRQRWLDLELNPVSADQALRRVLRKPLDQWPISIAQIMPSESEYEAARREFREMPEPERSAALRDGSAASIVLGRITLAIEGAFFEGLLSGNVEILDSAGANVRSYQRQAFRGQSEEGDIHIAVRFAAEDDTELHSSCQIQPAG